MNVRITAIRHRWPEKAGFSLNRPKGAGEYIMLHFLTPVRLTYHENSYEISTGGFIVFSPDTGHSFSCSERLVHDWMHLSGDVKKMMENFGLKTDTLYQLRISSEVSEITAYLEKEFWAGCPYFDALSEAKLTEMFIRISRNINGMNSITEINNDTMDYFQELRANILLSPELDWTIQKMSDYVNLSPSRFSNLYRSLFGISPINDLIQIKIEKARTFLSNGMSVFETAETLGYSNVYHFIRQFKQLEGITPKQYALNKKASE